MAHEQIVDGLQCTRALVQTVLASYLTGFDLPLTVSLVADCIIDVETSALFVEVAWLNPMIWILCVVIKFEDYRECIRTAKEGHMARCEVAT